MTLPPPPGSTAARLDGCTCPTAENEHGFGRHDQGLITYITDTQCPIHHPERPDQTPGQLTIGGTP